MGRHGAGMEGAGNGDGGCGEREECEERVRGGHGTSGHERANGHERARAGANGRGPSFLAAARCYMI